jgi:hypothetical protein
LVDKAKKVNRGITTIHFKKKREKSFTVTEIYSSCDRIVVPDGTTKIFTDIDFNNPLIGINEVEIADTVKYIGCCAFMHTAIKTLFIPYNVEIIESLAFYGCKNLERVIIENGSLLKEIEMGAFKDCPSLKVLTVPVKTKVAVNAYDSNTVLLRR